MVGRGGARWCREEGGCVVRDLGEVLQTGSRRDPVSN